VTSTESVVRTEPFTVRRRVRFGDCDPASVVYTVRFSDYVVSAMDLFLSHLLEGPYLEHLGDVTTPMKALSFVFRAPLRPNDEFDMVVTVPEIRTRTVDLAVRASLPSGERVFDALVTPICITTTSDRRSVPIPDGLRSKLISYQQRTKDHASSLSD
jgi:acyl-CoA thioester hydrolase